MACVQWIGPNTMATHGQNRVTIVFGPMHWSTESKLNPICKLDHGNKFETWDIIALEIHTTKLWDTNLELFRIEGYKKREREVGSRKATRDIWWCLLLKRNSILIDFRTFSFSLHCLWLTSLVFNVIIWFFICFWSPVPLLAYWITFEIW